MVPSRAYPRMKTLPTRHARRRFAVARDIHGVPHIEAASWRAALYGLGYMHGVDRPTQLLFARAVASGRSAELIADKPELLEMDRFFRRVGLYLNADSEVAGRLLGKTGTLNNPPFDQDPPAVKALAGYLPVEGGGQVEYSLVLNGATISDQSEYRPIWLEPTCVA